MSKREEIKQDTDLMTYFSQVIDKGICVAAQTIQGAMVIIQTIKKYGVSLEDFYFMMNTVRRRFMHFGLETLAKAFKVEHPGYSFEEALKEVTDQIKGTQLDPATMPMWGGK